MAVVDLGKLRFDWKGEFDVGTDYEARDVVRYQGDIYIFVNDHAAGQWNPSNANLMLSKIDVITTGGDLIFGDANGSHTRLAVDYDHTDDIGSVRNGEKQLTSKSTVPLPATVTKYLNQYSESLYWRDTALTTTNYAVTIVNDAGTDYFAIDGTNNPALTLTRGHTYVFDVSDSSVTGHDLQFKEQGATGATYTTGVTVSGTAGTAGATVTFVVPENAPDALRYQCGTHGDGEGNNITVQGGGTVTLEYEPFEQDTLVLDTSDASMTGHTATLSKIENGVHGGNANTYVSSVTDTAGNVYLQVSSANGGPTDGGDATSIQRTLYSYVNDSGFQPTYTGVDWPYVYVTGTLTVDPSVTATVTQNTLPNGYEVLLVNGRPAYQYTAETDFSTADGIGGQWLAFDNSGGTTSTAFTAPAVSYSHDVTSGVTYAGTPGTAGASTTYVVPVGGSVVYVYDRAVTGATNDVTLTPQTHPQTATVYWGNRGAVIQQTYVRLKDIAYTNSGGRLSTNVYYDINQYYRYDGPDGHGGTPAWTNGDPFRPQITPKGETGQTTALMHYINVCVGWDSGSYHQGGAVWRRYSDDNGSTWSSWERPDDLIATYGNYGAAGGGARTDVDFGQYNYTSNGATWAYQPQALNFNWLDTKIQAGRLYEYKLMFKGLNSTPLIWINWHPQSYNQVYSRYSTSHWNIQEVIL